MHVFYVNKKVLYGLILLIVITFVSIYAWSLLPKTNIINRVESNELAIDHKEYLTLITNLKRIYAKNKIKYVSMTLSDDVGDKESMEFWRPDIVKPSGYIDGCNLVKAENNITYKKPIFYINVNYIKQQSANINRDLNYCIGLLFLDNTKDINKLETLQKYFDAPGGTKNILLYSKK